MLGVASVILPCVVQVFEPWRFDPLNVTPTAGPVAPLSHSTPSFSGDHLPICERSATSPQTVSGGAAISVVTCTRSAMRRPYAR